MCSMPTGCTRGGEQDRARSAQHCRTRSVTTSPDRWATMMNGGCTSNACASTARRVSIVKFASMCPGRTWTIPMIGLRPAMASVPKSASCVRTTWPFATAAASTFLVGPTGKTAVSNGDNVEAVCTAPRDHVGPDVLIRPEREVGDLQPATFVKMITSFLRNSAA